MSTSNFISIFSQLFYGVRIHAEDLLEDHESVEKATCHPDTFFPSAKYCPECGNKIETVIHGSRVKPEFEHFLPHLPDKAKHKNPREFHQDPALMSKWLTSPEGWPEKPLEYICFMHSTERVDYQYLGFMVKDKGNAYYKAESKPEIISEEELKEARQKAVEGLSLLGYKEEEVQLHLQNCKYR